MIIRGKAGPVWIQIPSAGIPLESLPLGALVQAPVQSEFQELFGESIVFRIADFDHGGYPENSATLISDKGILPMCWDAAEPENPDSYRKLDGNNRYIHSNIAQWLNSTAPPGEWYQPTHLYDAPPTAENVSEDKNASAHLPGFLHVLEPWFVSKLLVTNLVVARCDDDGGGSDAFEARVFLASGTELGLSAEGGISEGPGLPIFSSGQSRRCYFTPEAIEQRGATEGAAIWWLRSPVSTYSNSVRGITALGLRSTYLAYAANQAVRPLCNLPAATRVSPPDQDGVHTILR